MLNKKKHLNLQQPIEREVVENGVGEEFNDVEKRENHLNINCKKREANIKRKMIM